MMSLRLLFATTVLVPIAGLAGEAVAQPVSGLYIGGGGGANFMQKERTSSITFPGAPAIGVSSRTSLDTGVVGLASVGYGLGNGFRIELEGDYRYNRISKQTAGGLVVSDGGREQKYGPMVNVLFDLDVGSPYVFPYVGGGAGYQWVDRQRNTTGNLGFSTPQGFQTGFPANVTSSGVDSNFAYQAIAGLSFPIPPVVGLSLTAEYRYFNVIGNRSYTQRVTNASGGPFSSKITVADNYNHSLMLGLRYAFNVAPPPVEAATPAPTPQASAARTYQVFFDWNHADLTDRARQIIAEAAQATTRVQVTRIEVSGYTDTSGSTGYNQLLSQKRAESVAAELVRQGVPRDAIGTQGFGENDLLVATGPDVREPQNRRVEIVLR